MNHDLIVVGAGPAGLTAATRLAQAGLQVVLVYQESLGGQLVNIEWIEGYPQAGERVEGFTLASALAAAVQAAGVELIQDDITAIEHYSSCQAVQLGSGASLTGRVTLIASGLRGKPLGIPGEREFVNKGLIHCALCDAGLYRDQQVAVCGGGNAGATEALHLARFASKVYVVEQREQLTASDPWAQRLLAHPRIEILTGHRPTTMAGGTFVERLRVEPLGSGLPKELQVSGVLVRAGFVPATDFLPAEIERDAAGGLKVDARQQTSLRCLLAAGDVCADAPRSVSAAVAAGAAAAKTALELLGRG